MGERYLIDTSAYSYYITKRLVEGPYIFFEQVIREESILSVITRMELLSWIPGNKAIEETVQNIVDSSIVLPLSEPIIQQTIKLRRHYKGLKLPDAIIAATAMVNKLTLLSTNDVDFQRISTLKYQSLSN
ncbi:type II toxin-antitoxin system VapC family toxin [Fibrella aquatilis]|uniref:Type II toxin-antitoxin system VapC family toxin n=1 Tax=Fibrella aquatilis TaxID=2817059 RepID=A0A939G867_9BACT|nr:type II toxin-antitoxin system VapC family toxin [Fibrella aquatilis]MBO0932765.1 type II toxin-antitoxin system VapC family toxin [Fibrella aquatilis]